MKDFSIEIRGHIGILNINMFRVTVSEVKQLKEYLTELRTSEIHNVIVNMSDVVFIDSAIIGAIVVESKEVRKSGGDIYLVLSKNNLNKLNRANILQTVFNIFRSVEDAVHSFKENIITGRVHQMSI